MISFLMGGPVDFKGGGGEWISEITGLHDVAEIPQRNPCNTYDHPCILFLKSSKY